MKKQKYKTIQTNNLNKEKDCMKKTKIKAYGKINLYFELVDKRKDGFHNIKSIMQNIDLYDEIILEEIEKGINIESNLRDIPLDERNTVYKAVEIIKDKYKIEKGLNIFLQKKIPHQAGLGGGSSDAAAVIEVLDKIWDINMGKDERNLIASQIGTDVHFFLEGGTSYIKGKGDITKKIKDFNWNHIMLIKPEINISTPYVYSKVKVEDLSKDDGDKILDIYRERSKTELISYFKNDLENIVFKEFKEIEDIKKTMIENKALVSLMSGSGSTVFGFFENKKDMDKCRKIMKKNYKQVITTKTIEKGYDYER